MLIGCSALQKPPELESAAVSGQVPQNLRQYCPEMIASCRQVASGAGTAARQENINKELLYSGGGAAVGAGAGALSGHSAGYYGGYGYDPYYGYYGRGYGYRHNTVGRNAAIGAGVGLLVGAVASQLTKTDTQGAYDQAFIACIRDADIQCGQKQAALAQQEAALKAQQEGPPRYHKKKRFHKRR